LIHCDTRSHDEIRRCAEQKALTEEMSLSVWRFGAYSNTRRGCPRRPTRRAEEREVEEDEEGPEVPDAELRFIVFPSSWKVEVEAPKRAKIRPPMIV